MFLHCFIHCACVTTVKCFAMFCIKKSNLQYSNLRCYNCAWQCSMFCVCYGGYGGFSKQISLWKSCCANRWAHVRNNYNLCLLEAHWVIHAGWFVKSEPRLCGHILWGLRLNSAAMLFSCEAECWSHFLDGLLRVTSFGYHLYFHMNYILDLRVPSRRPMKNTISLALLAEGWFVSLEGISFK